LELEEALACWLHKQIEQIPRAQETAGQGQQIRGTNL
jgi:hypothetical protein